MSKKIWSLFNAVANFFKVLSVAGAESTRLAILLSTSGLVYAIDLSVFNNKLLSTYVLVCVDDWFPFNIKLLSTYAFV